MPSVKVLVVHYRHKPGGYSHRLRMKIEAFLQEGWEVHYIAVEPYPYSHPNLVPHILWSPTPRFDTPLFWAWFFLVCPLYTLKVGLNIRPHLISVFSPPYGWICRLLKRLGKIPMAVFLRRCRTVMFCGRKFWPRFGRCTTRKSRSIFLSWD